MNVKDNDKKAVNERLEIFLAKIKELPRKKNELWTYYGILDKEEHNRLRNYFDDIGQFFMNINNDYPDSFADEIKSFSKAGEKITMIKKGFDKLPAHLPALSFSYYNTDLYLWYPKVKRFGLFRLPLKEQHRRWEPVNALNMGIRDIRDYYRKLMEDDYQALVKLAEGLIATLT